MSDFSEALERLTNGYYNSQPVSVANPGGLAADGHVANFPAALQDHAALVEVAATWIGTLGGDNLNAVADLTTLIEQAMTAKGILKNIYFDPVNGDDAADGITNVTRIKTWGRVGDLLCPYTNIIRFFGDPDADELLELYNPPKRLVFYGRNDNNTAYLRRKITGVDAATSIGGIKLHGGSTSLEIYDVDVELASTKDDGFITLRGAQLTGRIGPSTVTRTGTGTASFIDMEFGAVVNHTASNWTVDASAAGYVYAGVAAGTDPNLHKSINSDLTSA